MRFACVVFALLIARPAAAQGPTGEFLVNTSTSNTQVLAGVASIGGNGFIVTWASNHPDDPDAGVFAQRLAADATPLGAEFHVNSYTTGQQSFPRVSANANGFVVVWDQGPIPVNVDEVVGQRYTADGSPVGGNFRIDDRTGRKRRSDVSVATDGSFLVAWNHDEGPAPLPSPDIHARFFEASGQPVGGQFRVNTTPAPVAQSTGVSGNGSGLFVVVWKGSGAATVLGQRLIGGTRVGSEFVVSTVNAGQTWPSVAMSRSGEFVVAYGGTDGSSTGIFARRYDAAGAPLGPEFLVNTYTTGAQEFAAVTIDRAGGLVVVWNGAGIGDGNGVFGQRFDAAGVRRGGEFGINTAAGREELRPSLAPDAAGNLLVAWESDAGDGFDDIKARRLGGLRPVALSVDPRDAGGNDVLDPVEVALVRPGWLNDIGAPQSFSSRATAFTGPAGPGYAIVDAISDYGTVPHGSVGSCVATGDCISVTVMGPRPARHWDARLEERIEPDGQFHEWGIHVGRSFADVGPAGSYYRFVETLVHRGVTAGCTPGDFCPAISTTREQMAVFALVAKEAIGYVAPACATPVFDDVPASSPFCPWIEELARRGVVAGCAPNRYCPTDSVTREQMAVFVLRTVDPALSPPACGTAIFADVPAASPFCRWIEELARRGVVTGCGGGNYCPASPVSREQIGVFISVTFGLTLYGP